MKRPKPAKPTAAKPAKGKPAKPTPAAPSRRSTSAGRKAGPKSSPPRPTGGAKASPPSPLVPPDVAAATIAALKSSGPRRAAVTRATDWKPGFLAALRELGHVTHATAVAGVSRTTAYNHRESDETFRAAWDETMTVATERVADLYEEEMRRRVLDGVRRPVMYEGKPVFVWVNAQDELQDPDLVEAALKAGIKVTFRRVPLMEVTYSDGLLIAALKAYRPQKYRERLQHSHDGQLDIRTHEQHAAAAEATWQELQRMMGVDTPEGKARAAAADIAEAAAAEIAAGSRG